MSSRSDIYNIMYDTVGPFWTTIFKDKALVTASLKANTFTAAELIDNLNITTKCLDEQQCPQYALTQLHKVYIDSDNIQQQLVTVSQNSILNNNVFSVGQYANQSIYVITLPHNIYNCLYIANTIDETDIVLLKNIDFVQKDEKTILLYKHPDEYGFKSAITHIDSDMRKTYSLYIKGSVNTFGYDNRFGRVPNVTSKNNITYDILANEVTYSIISQSFQKIIGVCPPTISGDVSKIWYEGDNTILYNGDLAIIPKELDCSVSIGDYITPSSILVNDIKIFNDIYESPVKYYYVAPNRLPYTDYGIIIPNTDEGLVVATDDILRTYSQYAITANDDIVITEDSKIMCAFTLSKNNVILDVKGTEKDVMAFNYVLITGLANYSNTIESVKTSNNPLKIVFSDIHNTKIPTIWLSSGLVYNIEMFNGALYSLRNMGYMSDILISCDTTISTNVDVAVEFEDSVSCFIVYIDNEINNINIDDKRVMAGEYI